MSQSPIKRQEQEARERARARAITILKTAGALVLPFVGAATLAVGGPAALSSGSEEIRAVEARQYQAEARAQAETSLDEAIEALLTQAFGITRAEATQATEAGQSLLAGADDVVVVRSPEGVYTATGVGPDGSHLSQQYTIEDGQAVPRERGQAEPEQDQQDSQGTGEQDRAEPQAGDNDEESNS